MKHVLKLIPIVIILELFIYPLGRVESVSGGNESPATSLSAPGYYILSFKPGVSPENRQQTYQELGATPESSIPQINARVVKMPLGAASDLQTFAGINGIADIEPDYTVKASKIANDPDSSRQWGLAAIQAPEAWHITHGSPTVKIAVLDSGIASNQSDLAYKVVATANFTDSPTSGDVFGHGTFVAGIAAAILDNARDVAGVGYNSSLMNVKVLNDHGSGSYSWIIQGIIWAADHGANVINLSISGGESSPAMNQAVNYAWEKGAVIVAAAGNNGNSTPSYPAYYSNCIAVAATNPDDQLSSFSERGDWVDVAAPGEAFSTLPHNKFGWEAGTSIASPFVAGLAGLAFTMAKDTDGNRKQNDEIRAAIQKGCDNIGVSGIGSGLINAYNTLYSLLSVSHPAPVPGLLPLARSHKSGGRR